MYSEVFLAVLPIPHSERYIRGLEYSSILPGRGGLPQRTLSPCRSDRKGHLDNGIHCAILAGHQSQIMATSWCLVTYVKAERYSWTIATPS